jgi:hypothetical protein
MYTAPDAHSVYDLRPAACYPYVYPERFDLTRISYYFDHDRGDVVDDAALELAAFDLRNQVRPGLCAGRKPNREHTDNRPADDELKFCHNTLPLKNFFLPVFRECESPGQHDA